jgi:hypothetical protein
MKLIVAKEYSSKETTCGSALDFLNEFYSTAQYRIVPIHVALRLFNLSANGEITAKQIDDYAIEELKFYAENPS